jgi:hypothetical protein
VKFCLSRIAFFDPIQETLKIFCSFVHSSLSSWLNTIILKFLSLAAARKDPTADAGSGNHYCADNNICFAGRASIYLDRMDNG